MTGPVPPLPPPNPLLGYVACECDEGHDFRDHPFLRACEDDDCSDSKPHTHDWPVIP